MLHLIFDNTKKIKDFAKSYNPEEEKGKEQQIFYVGDVVKSSDKSRYFLSKGKISDLYQENGFIYYIVNGLTFRQTDLIKL